MDSFQQQFQKLEGPAQQLRWLTEHRFLGVIDLLAERGLIKPEVQRLAAPLVPRRGWMSQGWLDEERRVTQALAAECRCLVLKGCLLAYLVYPGPQHRVRSDLDVLVPPGSLQLAREVLNSLGYSRLFDVPGGTPIDQESWIRRSDGSRFDVDLHWAMRKHPLLRDRVEFEEQWEQSVELPGLGRGVRGQGPVHALLNSVLHWFDGVFNEPPALAWLLDQDLLWRQLDERQRADLRALALARGVAGLLAESLRMTRDFLATPIDPALLHELQLAGKSERASRLVSLRAHPARAFLFALWAEPNWRTRVHRLQQSLFPPASYLRQRFPEGSRLGLPGLWWRRIQERL